MCEALPTISISFGSFASKNTSIVDGLLSAFSPVINKIGLGEIFSIFVVTRKFCIENKLVNVKPPVALGWCPLLVE